MSSITELDVDGRFEHGQVVLDRQPVLPEGVRLHIHIKVEPEAKAAGPGRWPENFFELTAGQADPSLERPPQGEYEKREPLE